MKISLDFVKKFIFLGIYPTWKFLQNIMSNHAKDRNSYDYEWPLDNYTEPPTTSNFQNSCNTPFKFAFGLLILGWIILGPLILVFLYMIFNIGFGIIWGAVKNIRENGKYKKEAETIDLEKKIEGSKESFDFLNLKKNEEQEQEQV